MWRPRRAGVATRREPSGGPIEPRRPDVRAAYAARPSDLVRCGRREGWTCSLVTPEETAQRIDGPGHESDKNAERDSYEDARDSSDGTTDRHRVRSATSSKTSCSSSSRSAHSGRSRKAEENLSLTPRDISSTASRMAS